MGIVKTANSENLSLTSLKSSSQTGRECMCGMADATQHGFPQE